MAPCLIIVKRDSSLQLLHNTRTSRIRNLMFIPLINYKLNMPIKCIILIVIFILILDCLFRDH